MSSCNSSKRPSTTPAASCSTTSASPCPSGPPCPPPDPWFAETLAELCPADAALLNNLRTKGVQVSGYNRIYMDYPYYDGTTWTTRHLEAAGMNYDKQIDLIATREPGEKASTLFHEGTHAGQPNSMTLSEKEYEAYTKTEEWRIKHGLPPKMARKTDAAGHTVPDTAKIRQFVDENYPNKYVPSATGGAPDRVVGHDPVSGQTILRRADGSEYRRAPEAGDTYQVEPVWQPPQPGMKVLNCQLACP